MQQYRQNSTPYQIKYRFIAHSTRNYGYKASFARFHLTAISQRNYHASAQIDSQLILFNQLCSNKTVNGATIYQSYNTQQLREHKLQAKLKKCEFGKLRVKYLGQVVGSREVYVDKKKVATVANWEPPRNIKGI